MDIYLSGMVDWKMKQLLVEGKFIDVDEIGGFSLDVTALTEKENPIGAFEGVLETKLTDEELVLFYELWGGSRDITITSTAATLNKQKAFVVELISIALQHGILVRGSNSAWKIKLSVIKERMLNRAKMIGERKNGSRKPQEDMDVVKKSLQSVKQNNIVENEEEVAYDPEVEGSVQGTLQTVAIKPGVPISRKNLIRKKPALGKSLVVPKKRA
jgi:hypothetical protein